MQEEKSKIPFFSENDNLYDWISCLIPNSVYFGGYPTKHMINQLNTEHFMKTYLIFYWQMNGLGQKCPKYENIITIG